MIVPIRAVGPSGQHLLRLRLIMKSGKRRALTWFLSGAAFVTAIVVSGCATRTICETGCMANPSNSSPAPTQTTPPNATMELVSVEGPRAPQINVFGEFDGVRRQTPRSIGEAGFQQHTYVDEGFDG